MTELMEQGGDLIPGNQGWLTLWCLGTVAYIIYDRQLTALLALQRRSSDLGLFSLGMSSRGEESAAKVTAQSIEGVHLILRNTKGWSNAELKKKCRIELLDNRVTVEEGSDGGGDNGGSTPATPSTPSGGSGSKDDNTGQGGGSSSGSDSGDNELV